MKKSRLGKELVLLLTTVAMVFFMGCGETGRYESATARNRAIAEQAVSIADDFLDLRIDGYTAWSRIGELGEIDRDTGNSADFHLSTTVLLLSGDLLLYSPDSPSERFEEILERRNGLATGLGMDER